MLEDLLFLYQHLRMKIMNGVRSGTEPVSRVTLSSWLHRCPLFEVPSVAFGDCVPLTEVSSSRLPCSMGRSSWGIHSRQAGTSEE